MTGFQIIQNSGDIVYSSGRVSTEAIGFEPLGETITDLNASQFWFYYHPKESLVISFFKGFRNVSQQLYCLYEGHYHETFILKNLKEKVETTFENKGWSTSESVTGSYEIYTGLDTAPPVQLAVDREELERIRPTAESDSSVQLGAPDHRTALQVCKRLVEQFGDDVRVSICGSGVVDNLPPSDFVVVPNTSEEPGELIRSARGRLERAELQELIDDTQDEVNRLIPTTDSDPDQNREEAVAAALEEAGVGESGIEVDTAERRSRTLDWIRWNAALAGGAATLFLAIVLSLLFGEAGEIASVLQRRIYPTIPKFLESLIGVDSRDIVLESWLVLVVSVGVVLATTLNRETVETAWKRLKSAVPSRSDGVSIDATEVDALVGRLQDIATHAQVDHDEFGGLVQIGRGIFEDTELEVSPRQDRRIERIRMAATWFGFGTVVTSVFVGVVAMLALGLSQIWTMFLSVLSVLAWLAIGRWVTPYAVWLALSLWKVTAPLRSIAVEIWGTIRPRRTYSTRDEVLRYGLGFVVTAPPFVRMAGELWAAEEGLGYQLVLGIALKLANILNTAGLMELGRENSVAVLYFTVLGFVLGLVAVVRQDGRYTVPISMLYIGILVGVVTLWNTTSLSVIINKLIPVWVVTGCLLSIGGASLIGHMTSDSRRNALLVQVVTGLLGLLVIVTFLEQHLKYLVSLMYSPETHTFSIGTVDFLGPERLASAPVDVVVSLLILTGLWSVSRGAGKVEVLVLGPRQSQADLLVGALDYTITETETGFEVVNEGEAAGKIRTLLTSMGNDPNSDVQVPEGFYSNVDIGSLEFDARAGSGQLIHIRTTRYRSGIPDNFVDVTERITREERYKLPRLQGATAPSGSPYKSSVDTISREMAEAYLTADVLVLAIPVDGDTGDDRYISPDQTVGSGGTRRYIDEFRTLLKNDYVDSPDHVFAVGTGAESLVEEGPPAYGSELRRKVTTEIFGEDVTQDSLRHYLDGPDPTRRVTPFYVWQSGSDVEIVGVAQLLNRIERNVLQRSSDKDEPLGGPS